MTLKSVREDIIKEFISQELLDDNVYPTLDIICAIALRDYSDTDVFESVLTDNLQDHSGSPASQSLFNKTTKYTAIDIKTLYAFVNFLNNTLDAQKSKIRQRLSLLSKAIESLTAQSNAVLMLNENADCFEVYSEDFNDLSGVDINNTTAAVDTVNHFASVKPYYTPTPSPSDIISSVDVNCLTQNYQSCINLTGNPVDNLYDGFNDTIWINEVTMPSDYLGNVEIALKFNLKEKITLNKFNLKLNDGNTNNYEAKLSANINGIWTDLSDYVVCGNYVDLSFNRVVTDSLILRLVSGKYNKIASKLVYTFYGQEVKFQNIDASGACVLQLNDLSFSKNFSYANFNLDTEIPVNCSIDLYAAAYTTDWQSFSKIDSSGFLGVSPDDTCKLSRLAVDLTYIHPYNSGVNVSLSYNNQNLPNYDYSKTKLIRNIGKFSYSGGVVKCYFYAIQVSSTGFYKPSCLH